MQKLITLEKVFDRVDEMSAACYGQNIDVPDILFDKLETVSIAGESHPVKRVAQHSFATRLGIPYL